MGFYSNSVQSTPGTSNDMLGFTAPASRRVRFHEISICGLGTSSAANELGVFRPTQLGTSATAQVSQKLDPDQASASTVAATAWGTQPSLGSVAILRMGCNSNGGIYRWVAKPGTEINIRDSGTTSQSQLSLRMTTGGAGPMGLHVVFEEF